MIFLFLVNVLITLLLSSILRNHLQRLAQKKEVENLLDKLITSQTILDECEKKIGGFNEFVKMLRREIDETIRNTQLSLKN